MQLENKIALITGASSGIGEQAARLFAQNGAKLILAARRGEKLEELANELEYKGTKPVWLAGDIQHEDYNKALVKLASEAFGGLDIAFNNAGTIGDMLPLAEMSADNWQNVINTNLTSAFYAAKHQIPRMIERGAGSIIFTSSFVGHTNGFPGMGAYAASKAGLIGLAQVLAVDYGAQNIRANALLPGGTKTNMAGDEPQTLDFIASLHALKRMAEPIEIAKAALFLASDQSSFVTGSAMIVDGGNSINKT